MIGLSIIFTLTRQVLHLASRFRLTSRTKFTHYLCVYVMVGAGELFKQEGYFGDSDSEGLREIVQASHFTLRKAASASRKQVSLDLKQQHALRSLTTSSS